MKIKHFLSSTFSALFTAKRGFRPFYGAADVHAKVVETSRYSHITNRFAGARVYMSKAESEFSGVTLTTGEVRRGDTFISFTVDGLNSVTCKVQDAKAMAATLASACMLAQPKTGRKMDAGGWATVDDEARIAKAKALDTASLFD